MRSLMILYVIHVYKYFVLVMQHKVEFCSNCTEPEVVQTEVKTTDEPSSTDDASKPEEQAPTTAEE